MKLYTSGELINGMILNNAELSLYWDDFEIWTDTVLFDTANLVIENVLIYPNPSNGFFNLISSSKIQSLYIYNYNGKLIRFYEKKINENLIIKNLKKGNYLILIQFANQSKKIFKIIKN